MFINAEPPKPLPGHILRGVVTTMRIRFIMPLALLLSFMLFACQQADNNAQPKVAVVDMARVMRDSELGKAGVKFLESLQGDMQTKLNDIQQRLGFAIGGKRVLILGAGGAARGSVLPVAEAGPARLVIVNRTQAKAEVLAADGAVICATPRQACSGADITLSLLENGDVVEQVLFGLGADSACHGLASSSLVIDMASIQPRQARAHAQRLQAQGVRHLDAPVSGGTVGAEAGTLAIMVGGDVEDAAQAAPIFNVLGSATHVGPHGSGQLAKLANQMIVGITIGAVAEALLLCEQGGADPAKVREAITGGFADSRILQLHGQRMVQRNFAPGARMGVQLKDLRNAQTTAAEVGLEVPITDFFAQLYTSAVEHGFDQLDHSGLFAELARRNGLQ